MHVSGYIINFPQEIIVCGILRANPSLAQTLFIMADSGKRVEENIEVSTFTRENSFFRRTIKNIVSGTFSGIAVCLVGHPFDTLKVRLQTQPVDRPVYKGLLDCFVKTMKWEGIGGLYKGVGK